MNKVVVNGTSDMNNYSLYYVVLTDNWVQGVPVIGVVFNMNASDISYPYITNIENTFYYSIFDLDITITASSRTIYVRSWASTSPSQVAPTISKIVGIL